MMKSDDAVLNLRARIPDAKNQRDDEGSNDEEICRVCRIAGEGELYHPCLCAGSIKYVHQECLLLWLEYSKKEDLAPSLKERFQSCFLSPNHLFVSIACELCNHKFYFKPVYSKDCPQRLPISDIMRGLFLLLARFLKISLVYIFVTFCWFGLVPLIVARTHQLVFSGLFNSLFSSRIFTFLLTENLLTDMIRGWIIMVLLVCTFIALVWIREQVNVGGLQDLDPVQAAAPPPVPNNQAARVQPERQHLHDDIQALLLNDPRGIDRVNEREEENRAQEGNQAREAEQQAAENMTWQRLLGLDGSFGFIENVLWVISLNFVFHVVFLLFPSIIGAIFLGGLGLSEQITYFKTAINIFAGYFIIVQIVYCWYYLFKMMEYRQMETFTHISYLIIKVLILIITELVIFPITCGCWLDVCSLTLVGTSLSSRLKTFHSYPISSTILHWLAGMLYVFYCASFIMSLKQLLRPGLLWFIRNLNDPEFSPINEMIQNPIQKHCRRFVASTTLFLTIIFLVVYCPLRIIKAFTSGVIPYTLSASDSQFGGFSLELVLLQFVLPSTLEHMKAFSILKYLVKKWCLIVGRALKLESYLLSRNDRMPAEEQPNNQQQNVGGENAQPNDLAGRHHALLMIGETQETENYDRPDHFYLRLICLLMCVVVTSVLVSLILLIVPVTMGRLLLLCVGLGPHSIHDIYSVSIGFYACWLIGKLCIISIDLYNKDRDYINATIKNFVYMLLKIVLAVISVLGVIPILLSIYFQLLIISPLRVSISQTPIFFPIKEWGMGVLHLKIICAIVMMGPDWFMKTSLEELYNDGFRGIRLRKLYIDVVFPVINTLTLLIVAPYIVVRTVLFYSDFTPEEKVTIIRFSFPALLVGILTTFYLKWLYNKLCFLHRRLRDDKYLIGNQLVNFYRDGNPTTS